MVLAARHYLIAAAYERAAQDETSPPQPRSGFAKKARWFRMLAQIEAAKEGASAETADIRSFPGIQKAPLVSFGFLAERLNHARATKGVFGGCSNRNIQGQEQLNRHSGASVEAWEDDFLPRLP